MKDLISLDEWTQKLSKSLTEEVLKAIYREEDSLGREFGKGLLSTFVASFVSAAVYRTLSETPIKKLASKEEKHKTYEEAYKNLAEIKTDIQEAVSAGFAGAMSTFANRPIEYYCIIKPVPPVKTDKMS